MALTTISVKGQVVIPKKIRELLGLRSGDKLMVSVEGDAVVLKPLRQGMAHRLWGKYQGLPLLTDLVAEHRAELTRE